MSNEKPRHINRRRFLTTVAAAGTAFSVSPADAKRAEAPRHSQLLLISHHGAAKVYPENTIEACDWAVGEQFANAIEIDVCFSGDGKLLLWHDWDPNAADALAREAGLQPDNLYRPRVPVIGSRWRRPVNELTLAEIRAHFGYEKLSGRCYDDECAPALKGEPVIPELTDFVAWSRKRPALKCVFLDIKMPCHDEKRAAQMLDCIHREFYGAPGKLATCELILMIPDEHIVKAMIARNRERNYAMKISWDIEFPVGVVINPHRYSAIDHAVELCLRAASVGRPTPLTLLPWTVYQSVIEYDVRRWKEVNRTRPQKEQIDLLVAWTVNDAAELQWLIDEGVSGIITDDIRLLRSLVFKIAGRSPLTC